MNSLTLFIEQFHWLRPLWLLGLAPAVALALLLWRQNRGARQWSGLIAPELLGYLLEGQNTPSRRWQVWGLLGAWIITSLALAGPSWEKRPMPVHKNQDVMVVVLDLSPSMVVQDLKPSRLARARLKIADLLRARPDGFTGLVAYAGDAHAVAPLTDDTRTINNLLPALHPDMMPIPGSNAEDALARAMELLRDGGAPGGQVLLITDSVVEAAVPELLEQVEDSNVQLSVLGVGTPDGAPIPNDQGGFERDHRGNVVVAQVPEDRLQELARRGGGRYHRVTTSSEDIDWLLSQQSPLGEAQQELEREFDQWYDRGHWLVLLLLPVLLYAFRPGLLLALMCLPFLFLTPQTSQAQTWESLWHNPNQLGQKYLEEEQPEQAAQAFDDPEWRGSALYRAEDYQAAAQAFAQSDTARAHYNRGNALAHSGELEQAVEAYDRALEKNPNLEDARANRDLVERLLEQQKQQEEQQQQDQQDGDQSEDQEKSQDGEQQQDSQNGENGQSQQDDESMPEPGDQPQEEEPQSGQGEPDEQDAEQESEPQSAGTEEEREAAEREAQRQADTLEEGDLSDEEQQALEQWLRRVPDDPSGLLRRKFHYESQLRQRERYRRDAQNDDQQRW